MIGMHRQTGKSLGGIAHLKQSIIDILLTPIGSRVMRRDYGSNLFELIDAPMNAKTIMDIVAATAEALDKWEPRIKVERVELNAGAASGRIELTLHGLYLPDGQAIVMDGIIL
jgi:phage baseplate assembly protein W